jgi:predicted DNA-binding WGR domain protein
MSTRGKKRGSSSVVKTESLSNNAEIDAAESKELDDVQFSKKVAKIVKNEPSSAPGDTSISDKVNAVKANVKASFPDAVSLPVEPAPAPVKDETVKTENKPTERVSYELHLYGENNRHLVYKVYLKETIYEHSGEPLFVVNYQYGSYGSSGKSNMKFFDNRTPSDNPDATAREKALAFMDAKYDELIAKGYVDEDKMDPKERSVKEAQSCPIQKAGDCVYYEWKDQYTSERAFFLIKWVEASGDDHLITQEGDIGGRGIEKWYPIDANYEESVNEKIKEMTSRRYKKKKAPTGKINCRIINEYKFDLSDNSENDVDDDDEDDD